MVGLGRVELPTSPLSGVRSSHLSYRPDGGESGGAGRDRTGDLLNANQALSQLSYSPAFFFRGRLDARIFQSGWKTTKNNSQNSSGDPNETLHPIHAGLEALIDGTEVGVERLPACTLSLTPPTVSLERR